MDTNGLKMLKSIRMVFDLLPIPMNKVVFVKDCIEKRDLVNAIIHENKCPVIHTIDSSLGENDAIENSLHIMVATGVSTDEENTTYIQCKNSYRNNDGIFVLNTFIYIVFSAILLEFLFQTMYFYK